MMICAGSGREFEVQMEPTYDRKNCGHKLSRPHAFFCSSFPELGIESLYTTLTRNSGKQRCSVVIALETLLS